MFVSILGKKIDQCACRACACACVYITAFVLYCVLLKKSTLFCTGRPHGVPFWFEVNTHMRNYICLEWPRVQ